MLEATTKTETGESKNATDDPDLEEDTERRKAEIKEASRQGASVEVSVYAKELRGALVGRRDADTFNREILDGYEERAPAATSYLTKRQYRRLD